MLGDGEYRKISSEINDHPYERIGLTKNTSAVAYQIKLDTWNNLLKQQMIPRGFDKELQDRAAVALIEDSGALGLLRRGKIEEAAE